jgi:WD40-like Beta Propeller Repeat
VTAPGGVPEKLCEGCLRATDWSGDEKTLLVFGGNPYQINALDVTSHRQSPRLKHPDYNLTLRSVLAGQSLGQLHGTDSAKSWAHPDRADRWPETRSRKRLDHDGGGGVDVWANWSPDGKTLYFTSGRDGHDCLWGQWLEPGSHRPVGEAFSVQHLHGRVSYRQGGWSAAGGRIGMALVETTGNVWMVSRSDGR